MADIERDIHSAKNHSALRSEAPEAIDDYVSSRRFSRASVSVDAIKYSLSFELLTETGEANVVQQLRLRQLQPTQTLKLDAQENLLIRQVAINGKAVEIVREQNHIEIALSPENQSATYLDLELQFTIRRGGNGLFFARNEEGQTTQVSVWSEPLGARYWMVSVDRPDDKALFDLKINAPTPWKVVANGTLLEHVSQGGREIYSWQMNAPMPTYLATFTAGDLNVTTVDGAPVPMTYWTIPSQHKDGLATFESSLRAMTLFNSLLIQYPFEKYSAAAAENAGGAMEHTTAMSYGSLVTEGAQYDMERAEQINVHELVHHWFGDTATCATWDHLWLNEGITSAFEAIYTLDTYGKDRYLKVVKGFHDGYFASETENGSGGAIVTHSLNPQQMFSNIRYAKSAAVLNMLRLEIGNRAFYTGLRMYLQDRFMKPAVTDDLQRALELASNRSLESFFQRWVYRAGYPDMRFVVSKDGDGVKVAVTQKQPANIGLYTLNIPVQLILKDGKTVSQKLLVAQAEKTFLLSASAADIQSVVIDPDYSLFMKREIQMPQEFWTDMVQNARGTYLHQAEGLSGIAATQDAFKNVIADQKRYVMLRAEALKIFASKFPNELNYILSFAKDQDKEMRRAVSGILRSYPLEGEAIARATKVLEEMVNDPSVPAISITASEIFARRKLPGAFEVLSRQMQLKDRANFRMRVISHLGLLGDARALPVLEKAVSTGMIRHRMVAAESLALFKNEEASRILADGLMAEGGKVDSGYGEFSGMSGFVTGLNAIHDKTAKAALEKFMNLNPPTGPKSLAANYLAKWQ